MLDLRSPVIWGAVPGGLVIGLLAWIVFGGSSVGATLKGFEGRLAAITVHGPRRAAAQANETADALAHPIFSVGGVALADASLRLDGVAITPRRVAALISINGQPATWIERGATRDGITLEQVTPTKVIMDTASGAKEVSLSDRNQGAAGGAPAPAPQGPSGDAPPGYRLPPPPASAPSPHR